MIKRIICFISIIMVLFAFSSCGGKQSYLANNEESVANIEKFEFYFDEKTSSLSSNDFTFTLPEGFSIIDNIGSLILKNDSGDVIILEKYERSISNIDEFVENTIDNENANGYSILKLGKYSTDSFVFDKAAIIMEQNNLENFSTVAYYLDAFNSYLIISTYNELGSEADESALTSLINSIENN